MKRGDLPCDESASNMISWTRKARLSGRTSLVLTAFDTAFSEVASITTPRMASFARRHGYAFTVAAQLDRSRPGGWVKILPIIQALSLGFENVFWIDADALILHDQHDILASVETRRDLHMSWLGPDTVATWQEPGLQAHYNTGVMLIRNSEWSRDFFARVMASEPIDHSWWEQATILDLLGYGHLVGRGPEQPDCADRQHVGRLDTAWNSVPGVAMASDPIVHHYAGIERAQRVDLLRMDAEMRVPSLRTKRETRARAVNDRTRKVRDEQARKG